MKKEITIFLSSTFEDLEQHRRKVIEALIKLHQSVQTMEYWAPSASTSLELSLKKLKNSKIYIGIIGTRYGTIGKDSKSITQLEFEEAVRLGIERQVYLIDEKRHPITFQNVDMGEKAKKLAEFKRLVSSQSVYGKFTSPDDLANQVITNLIAILKEEGKNIRAALNEHGISEFTIKPGYSISLNGESLDLSSFISMNESGSLTISDKYIESAAAAAVIAKNIHEGNLNFINKFITFRPEVYKITVLLLRNLGVDEEALAIAIRKCDDAFMLRLLINIAGLSGAASCAEPICVKLLATQKYHRIIQAYNVPITPFNDIVKIALSRLPKESTIPIVKKYLDLAKCQKKWQAKKIFESALKNLNSHD